MAEMIGSADTGASYFVHEGQVYAKLLDGSMVAAATALSANGRELDRHDRALAVARRQSYVRSNSRAGGLR